MAAERAGEITAGGVAALAAAAGAAIASPAMTAVARVARVLIGVGRRYVCRVDIASPNFEMLLTLTMHPWSALSSRSSAAIEQ
jgi:hypothetical protein